MFLLPKGNRFQKGIVQLFLPFLFVLFLAGAAFTFVNISRKENGINHSLEEVVSSVGIIGVFPTPTQFPFDDMTIPYLRRQVYNSRLSELEKYSENSDYTAYLTSYDSDGYKINGLLTIPKGEMPENGWPAVVFVHGYIPPQVYETTRNYISYVDFLAKRGLVVFKIDLRGHDDSEGLAFGAYYSGDYVEDTLNAHAALKNCDFVNSDKIGLWGHSMAGNIVFRSMIISEEIKKVVIWSGAVYTYEDFQEFRIQDTSYRPPTEESERRKRREELFKNYGEFDPSSDFWKQVVPTNYLEGVIGEVQIHHAVNDNVVNIEYSRNLLEVLKDSSVKTKLYEYPSGGHNIIDSSFTSAMQRSADFLKD